MHFGAVLEQNAMFRLRLRVVVACPLGMGSSRFLASRLGNEFPSLQVEGCCSVRELNAADLRRRKIDFIISTVPLELDYPAVCISPSLLEPDRAVLKDAITRYSQNRAEPEPAVQPVQDAPHAGSKLQYYARLTRSMTGLLEYLTIQPVKAPGSRAASSMQRRSCSARRKRTPGWWSSSFAAVKRWAIPTSNPCMPCCSIAGQVR